MADDPQSIPNRFYKVASDTLRAAQLGQYGKDYGVDQLRTELSKGAKNLIPNWSATNYPYVMTSPEADQVEAIIDEACNKFSAWDEAGRPPLT